METPKPQPGIVLSITQLPNGQISVTGPLGNTLLCYGMLESAKDVVRKFNVDKAQAQRIVLPEMSFGPAPGNGPDGGQRGSP